MAQGGETHISSLAHQAGDAQRSTELSQRCDSQGSHGWRKLIDGTRRKRLERREDGGVGLE